MGESLVSKELLDKTESAEYFRMHPEINVLKIGHGDNPEQLTMFCKLGYIPLNISLSLYTYDNKSRYE